MSRSFPILSVAQTVSSSAPGEFVVASDFTSVFQGKFYRQSPAPAWPTVPATQPFYTSATTPVGFELIVATTFEVVDNPSYNGRYSVFTATSAVGVQSSSFAAGNTTIRVNEVIGAPTNPAHATNTGRIINVSTFLLDVAGENSLVIPPTTNFDSRAIDLFGRSSSGWGEGYAQNFIDLLQNFASNTSPANPFLGQLWYHPTSQTVFVYNGSNWITLNSASFAPANSFMHVQSAPATTWTINHNLNAPSPFIVMIHFFKDVSGQPKIVFPSDVTFVNSNTVTCTFVSPESGWALVRL